MEKSIICLITSPISEASIAPVSHLANILSSFSKELIFITGNAGSDLFKDSDNIRTFKIRYILGVNPFSKIIRHLCMQLKIAYILLKERKRFEICVFFIGANNLVLPILIAKLLRKYVVLSFPGSSNMLKFANDKFFCIVKRLENINCFLANKIILYSPNLLHEWNFEKYEKKVSFAHEHYLDFNKFNLKNKYESRKYVIGYVGRLSSEKGIFNLIQAIPEIVKIRNNLKFEIFGDGELRHRIESYLDENKLTDYVTLSGWVSHQELPDRLNKLKLIVLPSYTEGLPNIMLESMACGTPVLASPVGAIPYVIEVGVNGFILENNSPQAIAKGVIKALECSNLEIISDNSRKYVVNEFSFESTIRKYRSVINS